MVIWAQTATCATYSINWLVFITEMKSVYSAVRTGSLNKAVCASSGKFNFSGLYLTQWPGTVWKHYCESGNIYKSTGWTTDNHTIRATSICYLPEMSLVPIFSQLVPLEYSVPGLSDENLLSLRSKDRWGIFSSFANNSAGSSSIWVPLIFKTNS